MTSLLTALLLSTSINIAEAHPNRHRAHAHRPHRHVAQRPPHAMPPRPPRAVVNHHVTHRHGHWVYPHSNSAFIWRYTPGHYTRRGVWVAGHWRVVIRLR